MTERGLPIVEGAAACPFVAFDDARDDRADRPDPRHRCYAESPPTPRARAHQEAYCLSATFPVCPTFQDWARREAARVLPPAGAGSPAERLRDVPAQREAGERPPAFGPLATPGSMTPAGATGGPSGAAAGAAAAAIGLPASMPGVPPGGVSAGGSPGSDHDSALDGDATEDADLRSHEPWDLPARRTPQPGWSAPPPWAPPRGSISPDEIDPPGFLRAGAAPGGAPRHDDSPAWALEAPDDDGRGDSAGGAVRSASAVPSTSRDVNLARLRAMGIGDPHASEEAAGEAMGAQRPVSGMTRPVDPVASRGSGTGRGPGAASIGLADAASELPEGGTAEPGGRTPGRLARLLGWDRRPRVGASRPARRAEREPAWERPRRFEAYPTLKTRVGVPMPSRPLLALGAILVAAAILFIVPPLFLKQGAGGGPGATRSPGSSASLAVSSPSASVGPTGKPAPSAQTYTVHQGDTLVRIAKRFGVTVEAILAANKNIKNPNKIAVGDVVVIPSATPGAVVDGGPSASP